MILKGNSRKGGRYLVEHMLNENDNDHVEVHEVRGFASDDFEGAVGEVDAIAKGTKCTKNFFSLSLNPPAEADFSEREYEDAIDQCEKALGLQGQPRAIIFHEKEGRRHCHVIWSRIDTERMQAIPDSFTKLKLREVSKSLFRQHGWELPSGLQEKVNAAQDISVEDQAIAKRSDLTLADHEKLIGEAWRKSDDAQSFAAALEEQGYILAHGKRGHVAVDVETGDAHSIPRRLKLKKKEVEAKIGPPSGLPDVDAAKQQAGRRRQARSDAQSDKQEKQQHYQKQLNALKRQQIKERDELVQRQLDENSQQERSFVSEVYAHLKNMIERSKAEFARLKDKWMGKDVDAMHAVRIANLRKTQDERFAEERDSLRREHMRQRRELQRPLQAERHVSRQAAIAERQAKSVEKDIAAKQTEIRAKFERDKARGKGLDR